MHSRHRSKSSLSHVEQCQWYWESGILRRQLSQVMRPSQVISIDQHKTRAMDPTFLNGGTMLAALCKLGTTRNSTQHIVENQVLQR